MTNLKHNVSNLKKGYTFILSEYYGRFGNNLIQISNLIHLAKTTESLVILKPHNLININRFDFRNQKNKNCEETITSIFYYLSECLGILPNNNKRHEIFQEYIYDLLVKKNLNPFDEKTLVIHLRSGDIFMHKPNISYLQPPFSYYKFIIDKFKPKKIILVTEKDMNNPCIKKIHQEYQDKCQIQSKSLIEDIHTMLSAQVFVTSNSSLSEMLSLLSKNLKILFTFNQQGIHDGIKHLDLTFKNYIEFKPYIDGQRGDGNWKCSSEQLKLMITHTIDNIEIISSNFDIDNILHENII